MLPCWGQTKIRCATSIKGMVKMNIVGRMSLRHTVSFFSHIEEIDGGTKIKTLDRCPVGAATDGWPSEKCPSWKRNDRQNVAATGERIRFHAELYYSKTNRWWNRSIAARCGNLLWSAAIQFHDGFLAASFFYAHGLFVRFALRPKYKST